MDKLISSDTSVYSTEICSHEFGLWRGSNKIVGQIQISESLILLWFYDQNQTKCVY